MDVSIANLLFLIIGLFAGFLCGHLLTPTRLKELKEDVHIIKSIARKNKKSQRDLGTVHRPNAQTIHERGTIIEATKNAMRETLQNDPYLNEHYE